MFWVTLCLSSTVEDKLESVSTLAKKLVDLSHGVEIPETKNTVRFETLGQIGF